MKNKFLRIATLVLLTGTLSLSSVMPLAAQCPMCRATAESNLKHGGASGKGLNAGILYMLATPYLLVGAIAFVWIRNRRREEELSEREEL